jgi:hypothetical protein
MFVDFIFWEYYIKIFIGIITEGMITNESNRGKKKAIPGI